jgi:hypothetical protein
MWEDFYTWCLKLIKIWLFNKVSASFHTVFQIKLIVKLEAIAK